LVGPAESFHHVSGQYLTGAGNDEATVELDDVGPGHGFDAYPGPVDGELDLADRQPYLVSKWLGNHHASCLVDGSSHTTTIPETWLPSGGNPAGRLGPGSASVSGVTGRAAPGRSHPWAGERLIGMRWIVDNAFDERYQFWTRANVSEVLPEPPTPLSWHFVFEGAAIAGWYDLFTKRCGMGVDELDETRCEAIGIFGGYAYLGATLFRIWAGRTPGLTPGAIDEAYFGDHPDVPPYVEEPWHTRAETTEVMGRYMSWPRAT
jgi:hypothetical protein